MILNRINEYRLYKKLNFNKFEISLGVSHGSLSNAWKRKRNIGSNVIEKIVKTYPDLSAEWLLRGKGAMLVGSTDENFVLAVEHSEYKTDAELIEKSLRYFNLSSKMELNTILGQSQTTLEETILATLEKKYGPELKRIHQQLMILFEAKLRNDARAQNDSSSSKIS